MNCISEILITSLGFAGFAVLHTLLARQTVKQDLFGRWPALKPYYRLLYSVFATVTLGAWYLFSPFPEGMLYSIPFPYSLLFRALQVAGGIGFLFSLKSINLVEFIGFEQIGGSGNAPGLPEEPADELVTDGLYGWVRHPLYSTSIMVLLFNPVMSAKLGLITILVILYCWIGSIFEERNLVKLYGKKYIEYRRNVPRFIPGIPLF